jgi:hypothetical protein
MAKKHFNQIDRKVRPLGKKFGQTHYGTFLKGLFYIRLLPQKVAKSKYSSIFFQIIKAFM